LRFYVGMIVYRCSRRTRLIITIIIRLI